MPGPLPDDPSANRAGATQDLVAPAVSTNVDGTPLKQRLQAVTVADGQTPTVYWTVRNSTGDPVNIADLTGATVALRLKNVGGPGMLEFAGVIDNAAAGLVHAVVDTTQTGPGIFDAQLAVFQAGRLKLLNRFWLMVERSLFGNQEFTGVPTVAEVRMHLRDSQGAENVLLDLPAFDDAEIMHAMLRAVDIWNEEPPPVQRYTLQTFPFRARLLDATVASLYRTLGLQELRNWRNINAAGMTVSGPDRGPLFLELGEKMLDDYREWVRRQKVTINIARGWGGVPSGYSFM